jgi:hypothetical protein
MADVADNLCVHARCGVTAPQAFALCPSESSSLCERLLSVPLDIGKGRSHSCAHLAVGSATATMRKAIYFTSEICGEYYHSLNFLRRLKMYD